MGFLDIVLFTVASPGIAPAAEVRPVELVDNHLGPVLARDRRLTYRFGGRDMSLTDVHGEVLRELLV